MKISDRDHEVKFTQLLTSLLDEHKDVVSMLADGFYQSRDYIEASFVDSAAIQCVVVRVTAQHLCFLIVRLN